MGARSGGRSGAAVEPQQSRWALLGGGLGGGQVPGPVSPTGQQLRAP